MANQQLTSTDLRRALADILEAVNAGHHQEITHYGRPNGVIVDNDWYRRASHLMDAHHAGRLTMTNPDTAPPKPAHRGIFQEPAVADSAHGRTEDTAKFRARYSSNMQAYNNTRPRT
jgi:prevent-host-death family protein